MTVILKLEMLQVNMLANLLGQANMLINLLGSEL